MSARDALRDGTRDAHERVDAAFSAFDIAGGGGYAEFLSAQARALLPTEGAIDDGGGALLLPDWPQRRRGALLRADLAALGVAVPQIEDAPIILGTAAAKLGAIYVLEGSRMGAAMLRRQLPPGAPQAFLGARGSGARWKSLLAALDAHLNTSAGVDAAIGAARMIFMLFENAASGARTRAA